ncbi:MAG: hypothetical protein LBH02_00195, partial [Methanocalculaceae archaeon]|nr:hypothetical protein [Methanocalculaceae archaeon]
MKHKGLQTKSKYSPRGKINFITILPPPEKIAALIPKIRADSEKLARQRGWTLNPNTSITDSIIEGLARNKLMRGKRYCPCRLPSGNIDVDKL